MMQRFDVAIVGSGPAGAATALRLTRMGFAIALIDEQVFPRTKLCGEYLNLGAVHELDDLGMRPTLEHHAVGLQGMRLFAHDEMAEFRFSSHAWSIPRKELDERIRTAAVQTGAQTFHGRVRRLSIDDRGALASVAMHSGEEIRLRARFIIGADGMRSVVARLCKLTAPIKGHRFAVGGHYSDVELENWIEMYYSSDGYLALNPLSMRSANVVFVMEKEQLAQNAGHLDDALTEFSGAVTNARRIIESSTLQGTRNAIGPLTHYTHRPASKKVLLVGDAAAFVDPFVGQGVYLALVGARAAVEAIERSLRSYRDEPAAWRAYEVTLRKALRERKSLAFIVQLLLTFRFAARQAAVTLRRRPYDFTELIEAVCGNMSAPTLPQLAITVARALR